MATMIKFVPSADYIILSVIDRLYKIQNFYLDRDELLEFIGSDGSKAYIANDCYDYARFTKFGSEVHIVVNHIVPRYDGRIEGRQADVFVDGDAFKRIVRCRQQENLLAKEHNTRPAIIFSEEAQARIGAFDPLTRRAFSKYMRDAFCWPRDKEVYICADFMKDSFGFSAYAQDGWRSVCGGIILSESERKVRAGRRTITVKALSYSTHT